MSGFDDESATRRQHLFRGRRVKILDLVNAGLLAPGTTLVFDRPQVGERFQVTVTQSGQLRLPDGRETSSLSGAIMELTGKSVDGWYAWRTVPGGVMLNGLRRQLLDRTHDGEAVDEELVLEDQQDKFLAAAKEAAEGGSPHRLTVRELIAIWGARGRGFEVNERVGADLVNNGLTTVPEFRAVTLDDTVAVVLTTQDISGGGEVAGQGDAPGELALAVRIATVDGDEGDAWDHGLTIGNLPSASRKVCSVAPNATFEEAITLMITEDYSQLAVMTGPRELKGAVSWKSIAKARNADQNAKLSAAITRSQPVPYTADLIATLSVIQSEEFVFVRGVDNSITGIVTLVDVVDVYAQMASPFFLIGRIDQNLRSIVEKTFPVDAIVPICDPDGRRDLKTYDQLTMGDYRRILENPVCWDKLNWLLHRKTFCARLGEIAAIRNSLMHFNNDPLPGDIVSKLQNFASVLAEYGKL